MPKLILWSPTYPSPMCDSRATSCYPLRLRTVWLWINRTEMSTSWPCKVAGSCQGSQGSHHSPQGSIGDTHPKGHQKRPKMAGPGRLQTRARSHIHTRCQESSVASAPASLVVTDFSQCVCWPTWNKSPQEPQSDIKMEGDTSNMSSHWALQKWIVSLQKEKTTCDLAHSTTLTGPL